MVNKKLSLPKNAEEVDISDCRDFDIVDSPINNLVAMNESKFSKYDKWIKLKQCSVKLDKRPKIPISEKEPHLEEARVLCRINEMALKEQGDNASNEDFYKENFSLIYNTHENANDCHSFLKFGSEGSDDKQLAHYTPKTLQIILPKKKNRKDKSDSNLQEFKQLTTMTSRSKSK